MLNKISVLVGTIVLSGGFLALFFGGTMDGARVGLEIIGILALLEISHKVIIESREEKKRKRESNKLVDKYFKK